jgi:hypothetical protein
LLPAGQQQAGRYDRDEIDDDDDEVERAH